MGWISLYDYFSVWMATYIVAWAAVALAHAPAARALDPLAIALVLFWGNVGLLAVRVLAWRTHFELSFFAGTLALHGFGLALPMDINPSGGWRAPLRNLVALGSLYWLYVTQVRRKSVVDVYRTAPTRWSHLLLYRAFAWPTSKRKRFKPAKPGYQLA